ncbi:unannotated protein [freshwater metagenome]|uniref:Unannotated protein n=1 Tax=freshwater metagenome TaxID=449393 RepID=A0A6J6IK57_9ZZZZ|nr:hypothetical protein [Actinomycetota bacterium]
MNLLSFLTENTVPGEVIIDDTWYSPGVIGFIATFGVAAAAVLLIFDLVRRIRRVRYRAEISEKLDLEQLEQDFSSGSSAGLTKPERPTPPEKPQR